MLRVHALLIICLVALAGCKSPEELAGTGALVLSPNVKAFIDKYDGHDAAIAVSYQGDFAYIWGCPVAGAGNCEQLGVDAETVVRSCEERVSKCGLYRYGDFVLWRGSVDVGG